jgi:hypothetical protein
MPKIHVGNSPNEISNTTKDGNLGVILPPNHRGHEEHGYSFCYRSGWPIPTAKSDDPIVVRLDDGIESPIGRKVHDNRVAIDAQPNDLEGPWHGVVCTFTASKGSYAEASSWKSFM